MKLRAAVGLLGLAAAPSRAAPYGCWSIADQIERLTCFDMALGPPATDAPLRTGSPQRGAPFGGTTSEPNGGPPALSADPETR